MTYPPIEGTLIQVWADPQKYPHIARRLREDGIQGALLTVSCANSSTVWFVTDKGTRALWVGYIRVPSNG